MQENKREISLGTRGFSFVIAVSIFIGGLFGAFLATWRMNQINSYLSQLPSPLNNSNFIVATQRTGIKVLNTSNPVNSFAINQTSVLKCYDANTQLPINCTLIKAEIAQANANSVIYFLWNKTANKGFAP